MGEAIRLLRTGGVPMNPMIARQILTVVRAQENRKYPPQSPGKRVAPGSTLTERETRVLEMVARGYTYAEVAEKMEVSLNTVRTHVKNLYGKLSVSSGRAAIFEARRLGLLPGESGD